LTHDGISAAADLGDADTIDAQVAAFRNALGQLNADHERLARELYQALLAPLLDEPRDFSHIVISPDGFLNALPFAALRTPEDRYLVDLVSTSYLYSGRDLLHATVAREDGSVVVIADPDFGTTDDSHEHDEYERLEGTLREAELIRAVIPAAELLLGRDASKAALLARSRPLLLHIATHGEYHEPAPRAPIDAALRPPDNDVPATPPHEENALLHSWLALSGANVRSHREDGILTALEVTALDLHGTALVTLSACDTAVGAVRPGDGVYGMARAFQLAGVRSLLATLWQVEDNGTRELVRRTYTQLCAGALRVNALCNVQREMMGSGPYRHPFYWSGFVMVGDFDAIPALAPRALQGT
jgi:CHAT domain-containing protein